MILGKSPPISPAPRAAQVTSASGPRAPAVRLKLETAQAELAALDAEVATLTLDDAEEKPGARKALTAHRSDMQTAERRVDELKRALALAEKFDRQAAALGATAMRAEQFAVLRKTFDTRETAMADVLKAAADMAKAFGAYSEASLKAVSVVPVGATVPQMAVGPDGAYGTVFGPCELLILAELWRLAPDRKDGTGRFILPFAKPVMEMTRNKPEAMPEGMAEFKAAHAALLANISEQIEHLNETTMRAAEMTGPAPTLSHEGKSPLSFAEAIVEMAAGLPAEAPAPAEAFRQPTPPPLPSVPAFDAFTTSDADAIAGLTADDCCKACSERGCILTGGIRCAHPHKGGLAKADQLRPEVMTRYATACTSAGLKNIHAPDEVDA
ncbi:hypothetical protein M2232_001843 [Bradyrhizobium japonicum]|uniref:hypothetical protein n=1 Tax=Bradyrhizobium japonicum TaxID=375 RepID=UPI002227B999|nr:hypothetical protein [Bradyrhizobium japonicum]MCW2218311.1 hypothetical protein [Bradyrhizobium japonicum]MCW2342925.1 hypothetical protein [Bradyrhizobium japonicum]